MKAKGRCAASEGLHMERVLDYAVAPARPGSPPGPEADGLERECRRLEHLLAGYQLFLGHDLANQLVAIQGFARHLESEASELHPDAALLLTRLADLTRRADRHGRRLAEIGRLLRDRPYGHPVPLLEVVQEAVASVKAAPRPGADGQTPAAVFEIAAPMPRVILSGKLMHLTLVELLHNALAALPADRPGRISVRARLDGDACVLTVRDNGRGFGEARLAGLGEQGQLSPVTNARALGYFVILQAVARWRGRLVVDSEPGHGTTVLLSLPGARAESETSEEGLQDP
jgi:signal transduction histidine kinase